MELTENEQMIVNCLEAAAKGGDMGRVQVSMGHFIVDEDGDAVPFEGINGRLGLKDVMARMSAFFAEKALNDDGDVIACSRLLSSVELGLGGQIVINVVPMLSVGEFYEEYKNVRFRLEQILEEAGSDYSVICEGFNPSTDAAHIPEMPVPQLKAALEAVAEHGAQNPAWLFKGAAGCSVTIEYADEEDAIRKARVATLLAPILGFVASNIVLFDGEASLGNLQRMRMLRAACPHGKGVLPILTADAGFAGQAQWLAGTYGDAPGFTAEKALLKVHPDVQFVPGGLRIDVADAMPIKAVLGYVALIKGIFYGPASVELIEHFLKLDVGHQYAESDVDAAMKLVDEQGGDAVLYGRTVDDWIDLLMRVAHDGVGTEFEFLDNLQEFKGL